QSDLLARGAVVADDVVAIGADLPAAGRGDAADDADQGGLAGAAGPEQGDDPAAPAAQVARLQRAEAGGIGLFELLDRNGGLHAGSGHGPAACAGDGMHSLRAGAARINRPDAEGSSRLRANRAPGLHAAAGMASCGREAPPIPGRRAMVL